MEVVNVSALKGKVVLITGAGAGLGRVAANVYASQGAKLAVAARTASTLNSLVSEIEQSGGEAFAVTADITDELQVVRMVKAVVDQFGRLDCALNNAGGIPQQAATAESSTEEWERIIALNLTGTYFCVKHEITAMLKSGGGAIVNVASGAAHLGVPGLSAYSASKHGVIGLTRSAAAEYGKQGIRVNAVNPGIINTESYQQHDVDYNAFMPTSMGRIAEPEEVANAAAWLLSDQASFVTGHSLEIDGGRTTAAFVIS
jgi:NAD(P)-dependent dehydrogenase (short-subunit alcohol dehydrogenase family)